MAAAEKYFYAIGRRKTSSVTVRLFNIEGKSKFNDKDFDKLYTSEVHQKKALVPFVQAGLDPKEYMFTAKAVGGGKNSQLEALMLGISRAIIKQLPEKKGDLKKAGLLTRDPRMVERKKAGLRKARKAEQYSKR